MKIKMALASLSSAFEGKVKITDQQPPASFRLLVEGNGKNGLMKGEGLLNIAPHADGSEVTYEGDVQSAAPWPP